MARILPRPALDDLRRSCSVGSRSYVGGEQGEERDGFLARMVGGYDNVSVCLECGSNQAPKDEHRSISRETFVLAVVEP